MQLVKASNADLCVDTFGNPRNPALILIGGATSSMDWWRTAFCERLADRGLFVVRYDHRDTGQSTHSKAGSPDYTGTDLVADVVAILDALGVDRAHVAGISMGGGLGQALALEYPERICSLTLIATSPGGSDLPPPKEIADPPAPPDWSNRDEVIAYLVEAYRPYSGALWFDEDEVRSVAAAVVDRSIDIEASSNHWLLGGDGDPLRPRLGDLQAPTLVVHGTDDPMFPLGHGEALAREIPGARLLVIEGMGHEVPPPPAWDEVVAAILELTRS